MKNKLPCLLAAGFLWSAHAVADFPPSALERPTGLSGDYGTEEELPDLVGTRYSFLVHVIGPEQWPQGFYRIRNRNVNAEEKVTFSIYRPCGQDCGPSGGYLAVQTELTVPAGETVHANSNHLFGYDRSRPYIDVIEEGAEGPSGTIYWGMVVGSTDVLIGAYSRSRTGFISDLGSAGVMRASEQDPALYLGRVTSIGNPGSNSAARGVLRFINPYDTGATVSLRGWDDRGAPSKVVECEIPAWGALSLNTAQLERNASDARCLGVFGDGFGKWDIWAFSDRALATQGGLLSADLNITSNLSGSTVPAVNRDYRDRGN